MKEKQPMTQDEYVKAGTCCPWCGSDEYDCPDSEYDYNGGNCDYVCLDCGKEWRELLESRIVGWEMID